MKRESRISLKVIVPLLVEAKAAQILTVDALWDCLFVYLQAVTAAIPPQSQPKNKNSYQKDTTFYLKTSKRDLGVYYFNARWYDPTLGRFTCTDPAKDSINWYVYCSNNPITRTDPSGLAERDEAQTITNDTNKDSKIDDLFKNAPLIPDAMNCIVVIDGKIAFDPSKFNEGLKKIKDKTPTLSVGTPPVDNRTEVEKYVQDTLEQVIKGNYTDKNTLAGNIIMILAGLIDIDIPADIRDTIYDVTHFEANLEKLVALGLDIVGFLPLIGSLKNIKNADKIVEGVENVSKKFLKKLDDTGSTVKLPAKNSGFTKLKGDQGWKEPKTGNIWKKDQLHKDHWDICNSKGEKIKEIDFNGNQIWPNGPKNKNK